MAKTVRLVSGGYVTRAWGGETGFYFEIDGNPSGDGVILRPTRAEMLAIGALFRRAGLKIKKGDEKDEYDAPTLTPLGTLACVRVLGAVCGYHQARPADVDAPCGSGAARLRDDE
jgi:hypothetical protein